MAPSTGHRAVVDAPLARDADAAARAARTGSPRRNWKYYIPGMGERGHAPSRAPGWHGARGFLPDLLARAAHALVRDFAEELRGHGTSLPVWRVLAALAADPGPTVGGLAEACLMQQPTMTKLLDRMERDGLVARAPDARDRRVVRVALTPQGEAKAARLAAAAARHEAEVLARHPQAEAFRAVLGDIIARSGRGAAPRRRARGGGGGT